MLIDFNQYFEKGNTPKLRSIYELSAILRHLNHHDGLESASPLSGGYRNEHYLLKFKNSTPLVLRIASDIEQGQIEWTLLKQLSQFLPVPKMINSLQTSGHYFTLMSYLPGELPQYVSKDESAESLEQLGEVIGKVLGKIHQIHFQESGFFNTQLEIEAPFKNLGQEWLSYMQGILETPFAKEQLKEEHSGVCALLEKETPTLKNIKFTPSLVHSDFNLKNLLVRKKENLWKVAGVLDWEFAHAGCPLSDLGNFFRFDDLLPPSLFIGFLKGYQSSAGPLAPNWRAQAYLLDLASMCNFLDKKQHKPRNIKTAKAIIGKTLNYFDNLS